MKYYIKKKLTMLTPWTEDYNLEGVFISSFDQQNGSPKEGDMIGVNPNDSSDQWLVAKDFFEKYYEEVSTESLSRGPILNSPESS